MRIQDENVHREVTDLSPYSQPQYTPRGLADSVHGNWAPSGWPNNTLPSTSILNAPRDMQNPAFNEHQNSFDIAFQLPAPWAPPQNPVLHDATGSTTLPFPTSESTYRTSPEMMVPIPAGAPPHPSSAYGRNLTENNDENDENSQYGTTIMNPIVTSPETSLHYNVAWTSSSRRQSESTSQTPPSTHSTNGNRTGKRTSRTQTNRDRAPSNRSDTDSDSNQRSRGRLNHDLTEKRYRKRLNNQFETLLKALPAHLIALSEGSIGCPDDRREKRVSKAEVLMLAKGHIETLERRQKELEVDNVALAARVKDMNEAWIRRGEGHPLMP